MTHPRNGYGPGVSGWERRVPSWFEAVLIGLASRAFGIAVLEIVYRIDWPRHGHFWPSPFRMWDSFWYLEIAHRGYHPDAIVQTVYGGGYHDFAFFPACRSCCRSSRSAARCP